MRRSVAFSNPRRHTRAMGSRICLWLGSILQRDELWLFLGFAILYGLTAGRLLKHPSIAPYYVYLAESLLKGHTYLVTPPPTGYDLLLFDGRQYVPGGPLPALAFVPFVWLCGTPVGFSDGAVTSVWGACNVVLVYTLLGRLGRWVRVGRGVKLALAVVFGAGTPHWYAASLGTVWFTAHVCAVTFVCLYAREVLGGNRAWLAGLWLGLAGLARPTCWFAFPFFVAMTLACKKRRPVFELLTFGGVLAACVGLTLLYDLSRFGSPFDFGYAYVAGAENLVEWQARHGSFSLHFAPRNLHYMLLGLPGIRPQEPPWLHPDPMGMSIFLVTPPLLYAFKSVQRRRLAVWLWLVRAASRRRSAAVRLRVLARFFRVTPLTAAAGLSVLGVSLPLVFYHNTGSFQFGYRYVLDWLPIGLILVAIGMGGSLSWWESSLVGASVAINLGGTLWVYPTFNMGGEAWHVQWAVLVGRLWDRFRGLVPLR
jgi:hypothetical protein